VAVNAMEFLQQCRSVTVMQVIRLTEKRSFSQETSLKAGHIDMSFVPSGLYIGTRTFEILFYLLGISTMKFYQKTGKPYSSK